MRSRWQGPWQDRRERVQREEAISKRPSAHPALLLQGSLSGRLRRPACLGSLPGSHVSGMYSFLHCHHLSPSSEVKLVTLGLSETVSRLITQLPGFQKQLENQFEVPVASVQSAWKAGGVKSQALLPPLQCSGL